MSASFEHLAAGTDAPSWEPFTAGFADLAPIGPSDRLVVLAAHPDDETLGAAGLLASAEASGAHITVVVATDGTGSHPHSPTHRPEDLAVLRRDEVRAAVAATAPSARLHLLALPDGKLAQHVDDLTRQLAALAGDCTHLVSPWVGDRHPDHEACARAAAFVARPGGVEHWQYPIWMWHWGEPDDPQLPASDLRRLPLGPELRAVKEQALRCYPSQSTPLSDQPGDEAVLGAAMLAHFRGDEFFVIAPRADEPGYFDALYASSDDPWGLQDRFYERRKRATVLAALTRPRFRRAFEPGCATGLLTAELAERCAAVVAWDVAPAAVGRAAERVAGTSAVTVEVGSIPGDWPDGTFDLIVLSEVAYYCRDLSELVHRIDASLAEDGVLLACHWRHPALAHPQSAEAVHHALGAGRHVVVSHVEDDFLLDVWTRTGQSVAAAEGILR